MLNTTINLHLKKFSSSIAQDMKENLYVDNLISGSNSEDTIINYYKQSRAIMGEAKVDLRSWSSNCQQLRTTASCDHLSDLNADSVNILGLKWNTLSDTLSYTHRSFRSLTSSQLVTKRKILRELAQIYDPLGLLTPVTVKAKILVQTLWQQKLA